MQILKYFPVLIVLVLCGCTTIDGTYRPACAAYEGDEIEISEGRYTWRRFTDMRQVDENGELVDPFPDFPKAGRYKHHGPQLELLADDSEVIARFTLQDSAHGIYMLTDAENKQFQESNVMPQCALRRAQ